MNIKPPIARGFTLIELAITVAVASILLFLGIPMFQNLSLNNTRTSKVNELVTAIQFTRSEAVKRSTDISICRRMAGSTTACATSACTAAPAYDNCWQEGWVVFSDDNNNGTTDAGEAVLRVAEMADVKHQIIPSAPYTTSLTYDSTGAVNAAGSFTFCDGRGATEARAILINNTGRPRLSIDSNGDGTHDDETGTNLVCP